MRSRTGWGDHMNGWMGDHMGGWGFGMGLWGLLLVVLLIAALIKYLRS